MILQYELYSYPREALKRASARPHQCRAAPGLDHGRGARTGPLASEAACAPRTAGLARGRRRHTHLARACAHAHARRINSLRFYEYKPRSGLCVLDEHSGVRFVRYSGARCAVRGETQAKAHACMHAHAHQVVPRRQAHAVDPSPCCTEPM